MERVMFTIKSVQGTKEFDTFIETVFVAHYNGKFNTLAFTDREALGNMIAHNFFDMDRGLPTAIFKIKRFRL
jgi:hypothetical protein